MSDIINIQVQETVENVEIVAQNNVIEVNITRQSGGGGGAVDSVFGRTGVVTAQNGDYNAGQITETGARVFVTPAEKTAITHANRSILDAITEAFTTALKTAYDSAVTWISTNGANLLNHLTSTSNPHNTTASQVGAYTTGQVDTLLTGKENTITAGTTGQYYAWDKTFRDLNIAAVSGLQTALDGKADDPVVTDISLTSTIVGWSSFTRREITLVDYGACVLVLFALEGVSNSASSNFTLPFANAGGLTSNYIRTVNNSVNQTNPGNATIVAGSSVVVLNVNNTGGVFTASGNKSTIGQILIRK